MASGRGAFGVPAGLLAARWVHGELVDRGFVPAGFPMPAACSRPRGRRRHGAVGGARGAVAGRRVTAIRPSRRSARSRSSPRGGRVRLVAGVRDAGRAPARPARSRSAQRADGPGRRDRHAVPVRDRGRPARPVDQPVRRPVLTPVLRRSGGPAATWRRPTCGRTPAARRRCSPPLVLSVGLGGSVWFLQNNLERQTAGAERGGAARRAGAGRAGGLPAAPRRGPRASRGAGRHGGVAPSGGGAVHGRIAERSAPRRSTRPASPAQWTCGCAREPRRPDRAAPLPRRRSGRPRTAGTSATASSSGSATAPRSG